MGPGPVGSFSGLGAIFGLALAGAALRRHKGVSLSRAGRYDRDHRETPAPL